jgi:hypothetical protein
MKLMQLAAALHISSCAAATSCCGHALQYEMPGTDYLLSAADSADCRGNVRTGSQNLLRGHCQQENWLNKVCYYRCLQLSASA